MNEKPEKKLHSDILEILDRDPELKKKVEQYIQAEKLTALSRLVSGMAHEINNPLTAVIGYSQLLMDSNGQDMNRQLSVIRDQAMRCGKIIQDLLGFARKRKPHFVSLNLCEAVNHAIEMKRGDFEPHPIRLTHHYSSENILIRGDNGQLQKVFVHLISNAIDALENKDGEGMIEIRIRELPETVETVVKDNGCGIQEKHITRIYEPFFTTKEVGKGSGLGLSLCYGFIADHGGTITAESRWGEGSTFTVCFPKPAALPKEEAATATKGPASNISQTVLIVEDEEVVAGFVQKVLSNQGYRVEVAHDGEKAYQRILANEYDVILCDYRIPKMDGFELYEKIAQERPGIGRRFIFVTASLHFAEDHGGETFFAKHGLAYLQKPFTAQGLLEILEKRLSF